MLVISGHMGLLEFCFSASEFLFLILLCCSESPIHFYLFLKTEQLSFFFLWGVVGTHPFSNSKGWKSTQLDLFSPSII